MLMRLLFSILLIALLSFLSEYFFPWWTVAVVAFMIVLLFRLGSGKAFLAGFTGISLLWLLTAFLKDNANEHILSSKMAALFHLPGSFLFLLTGAVIGGLVGGLAGWSGAVVRKNLF